MCDLRKNAKVAALFTRSNFLVSVISGGTSIWSVAQILTPRAHRPSNGSMRDCSQCRTLF